MVGAQVTVLQFVRGKYRGQAFALDGESFVAGRSTEADLILADDAVSRKHARFFASRGRIWVRDLGSRNGTLVNGAAVDRHCLREGDRIVIGSSLCRVESLQPNKVPSRRAGEQRRGGQVAEIAGRSMAGSLEDIPLMDVLQWLATSRKTGCLKVRNNTRGQSGSLHLRDGRVFYAAIAGNTALRPEKALMRMLMWTSGIFELDQQVLENPPARIDMSLEHMLMEAARQQDELSDLAAKTPLPKAGSPVRFATEASVRWSELPSDELDFLQDMTQAGGWWSYLDRSGEDDVTLYRKLLALRRKGLIEW